MVDLASRWAAVPPRNRRFAIAGIIVPIALTVLTVAVIAGGAPPPATAVVSPSPRPTATAAESADASPASTEVLPSPSPTPGPPVADALLGTDGRLTVLLLGSDYRPAHPGNRTDAIMVVSLDPSTGKAAGFSVPRDTEQFPLPDGSVFRPKVNGLLQALQDRSGGGGRAMRNAVAAAFDIEVDGFVFIGFRGVRDLVGAVGGVDVTLDKPYYDAQYWVSSTKRGWGLPAGTSHLGPEDALIFARSRKGDNDFGRARRQQLLVLAALDKTRSSGLEVMPSLLRVARETVTTDLPLERADDLYHLVSTTDLSAVTGTVFGPRKFASSIGGSSFALNIPACREWIAANFPPARPFAAWPEALPATE